MHSEYDPQIESLILFAKSRLQMAGEYGVCPNTFKSKLKRAGIKLPAGAIFPSTQKLIYTRLGLPAGLKKDNADTF